MPTLLLPTMLISLLLSSNATVAAECGVNSIKGMVMSSALPV